MALKAASSYVVFVDGATLWSKHVESIANKWKVLLRILLVYFVIKPTSSCRCQHTF
jgi:predicted Na+-dependent transporter